MTLLVACRDDDDSVDSVVPADNVDNEVKSRRTVLVYMAAENNLDPFADLDLSEMKKGSLQLDEEQNLIVYVNRADSAGTPYMARFFKGELVDSVPMPDAIAADPRVLTNILRETRQRYPANSYGLVLWGHCTGWLISDEDAIPATRAYGGSTGDKTIKSSGNYWMNIPQMSDAISAAMEDDKLAFVFADCCNFACIEIAYELRNVADYIIGSPAEIPDGGAPYDVCVSDLFLESTNFYCALIDHYYDYWENLYQNEDYYFIYFNAHLGDLAGYSVPLVAIKTSELESLATATSELLHTIADKVSTTDSLCFDSVVYYGYESPRPFAHENCYPYAYDMKSVLKKNAAPTDYLTWKESFDKAVSYAHYSPQWLASGYDYRHSINKFIDIPEEDCSCVSMFFPAKTYKNTKPNWNKTIQQFQWNDVIHWEQYGW